MSLHFVAQTQPQLGRGVSEKPGFLQSKALSPDEVERLLFTVLSAKGVQPEENMRKKKSWGENVDEKSW